MAIGASPTPDDRVRKGIAAMVAPTEDQKARGVIMVTIKTPDIRPPTPTEPTITLPSGFFKRHP